MDVAALLKGYDLKKLTIGMLGGHSALDICSGAKKEGFRTVVVAQRGRERTYEKYFRTRDFGRRRKRPAPRSPRGRRDEVGCVDEVVLVKTFEDVLQRDIQLQLKKMNTIFIHSRYFWVYFSDFAKVEQDFRIPIYGNRSLLRLEERTEHLNQYDLLRSAGIRIPRIFEKPEEIDRPVLVKANERARRYERGFFLVWDRESYEEIGSRLEAEGKVDEHWREAVIEEFIVGAPVNFNFFRSIMRNELELLGTDTRRQTNLEGFLRMTSDVQQTALQHLPLKMIEVGHLAVTVKESLLERIFALGERFVHATESIDGKGVIGPFALQGAIVAEEGKEDIVIFDVSLRIPGSPGTRFTPYSGYLHGEPLSVGERIAREIREAVKLRRLPEIVT
jgi:5-formaminoimidazole-4-carboxamide-1-(beta)-D-ribofuranosyl 5'-monophosphate synthetase